MWQLSNLQIDSSVIQIVQSDVLRNSVDTTAAITNMGGGGHALSQYAMPDPKNRAPGSRRILQRRPRCCAPSVVTGTNSETGGRGLLPRDI